MPELPEVETIVRQLAPRLEGRWVVRVEILDPRLELDTAGLAGMKVKSSAKEGMQVRTRYNSNQGGIVFYGKSF